MRSKLQKLLPAIFLIVSLLLTYGFITGFAPDDMDVLVTEPEENGDETSVKWVCSECGYVYDPEAGDPDNGVVADTPFEELPEDWSCPDCGSAIEFFEMMEEEVTVRWVCPYCGYVYDPEENDNIPFEELPEDWSCPGCSTEKEDFLEDEEFGEFIASDPWIAHLQHVLEMRSKHIAVLERVIEDHEAKDPEHSSISSEDKGLYNALSSSSKSVEKGKAAIDAYLVYLGSFKTEAGEDSGEEDVEDVEEEELLNSGTENNEAAGNENGKGSNGNGNKGKKENKENKNNGKAKGKNK